MKARVSFSGKNCLKTTNLPVHLLMCNSQELTEYFSFESRGIKDRQVLHSRRKGSTCSQRSSLSSFDFLTSSARRSVSLFGSVSRCPPTFVPLSFPASFVAGYKRSWKVLGLPSLLATRVRTFLKSKKEKKNTHDLSLLLLSQAWICCSQAFVS